MMFKQEFYTSINCLHNAIYIAIVWLSDGNKQANEFLRALEIPVLGSEWI